jgi:hypothetical protein
MGIGAKAQTAFLSRKLIDAKFGHGAAICGQPASAASTFG